MTVAPHLLEQDFATKDLPRAPGQCEQKIELQRCELDLDAVPFDRMPVDADRKIPNPQGLDVDLFRGWHPAQPGFDSGDEFLGLEGLGYIIIGAGFQPLDNVDRVGLGCQHDDGDARLCANIATYVDTIAARQHQVQQHQVRLGFLER